MADIKKAGGLSSRLARVSTLGAELSKASNQLNAGLAAVQDALKASRLGVEAEVMLTSYVEEYVTYFLSFSKQRSGWGLYTIAESPDDERAVPQPLQNASKLLMMASAEKLPDLIDRLLAAAEAEFEMVAKRKDTVAEILTELGVDANTAMSKAPPTAAFVADDEIPF